MTLNTQETATVLAALRLWQESIVESEKDYGKQNLFDNLPDRFRDFFNDRNLPEITFPLDAEEIDALCERINLGEAPKTFVMTNINDGNDQTELEATEYNAAVQEALEMAGYAVLSHDEVAEHMGEDLEGEEDEEIH